MQNDSRNDMILSYLMLRWTGDELALGELGHDSMFNDEVFFLSCFVCGCGIHSKGHTLFKEVPQNQESAFSGINCTTESESACVFCGWTAQGVLYVIYLFKEVPQNYECI